MNVAERRMSRGCLKKIRCNYLRRFHSNMPGKLTNIFKTHGVGESFMEKSLWGTANISEVFLKEISRNWRREWWKYSVLQQRESLGMSEIIDSDLNEYELAENMIKFSLKITGKINKHFMVAISAIENNELCVKYCLFSKSDEIKHARFVRDWARKQPQFFKRYYFEPDKITLDTEAERKKRFLLTFDKNGEKTVLQSTKELNLNCNKLLKNVHTTLVTLHINNLTSMAISDALSYRSRLQNNRPTAKLMLHNRLAPVKCYVKPRDLNAPQCIESLANEICLMLRTKNIGCLCNDQSVEMDELAIPFTLSIPTNVEETGIVFLNDISTGIDMEVAVPHIDKVVLKYLDLN